MADPLFYSLWFPNFRLPMLPEKLIQVMMQLPEPLVTAASTYPLDWQQASTFQHIYSTPDTYPAGAVLPEQAVEESTELLHEDGAYEFEVPWKLWYPDTDGLFDPVWREELRLMRVVGFGPLFDAGAFEQNGQIRVELGPDAPFLWEEVDLDEEGQQHVKQNVERLIEFTTAIERNCGVETRLLWTESDESLAQKLIARLQKLN